MRYEQAVKDGKLLFTLKNKQQQLPTRGTEVVRVRSSTWFIVKAVAERLGCTPQEALKILVGFAIDNVVWEE